LGGIGGVALLSGLAGCTGGGGEGKSVPEDVPAPVHNFLTSGVGTGNYERSMADRTGEDAVRVAVGASGNGGNLAFDPPAMRIDAGTTVVWEWTGRGGTHNVVSVEDSEFSFESGNAVVEREPFERTFEEPGIGLYYCVPHASAGMNGAFEVV
jgi:halocyanin-like protein